MSYAGKPESTAAAAPAAPEASAPAATAQLAASAPAEPAAPQAVPEAGAQPQPEAAKPEAKTEVAPGDEPTFLETAEAEGAKKPVDEKPGDKKPGEEGAEKKPGDAEAEAPKVHFEPYTLPEGFKADQEKMVEFNTIVANDKLTPQERGQKLVDLYVSETAKMADHMLAEQVRVFGDTRKQWRREIAQDPEMGGAGLKTTENAVARMRDLFVPNKDMAAFKTMLKVTGAGDHPAFIRMMRNVARRLDEPSPVTPNFKPPPDIGLKPKSAAGRRAGLYDHPSSVARREGS